MISFVVVVLFAVVAVVVTVVVTVVVVLLFSGNVKKYAIHPKNNLLRVIFSVILWTVYLISISELKYSLRLSRKHRRTEQSATRSFAPSATPGQSSARPTG